MSRKLIEGLWKAEKAKLIAALPKVKISLKQLIDKPEFLLNDNNYIESLEEKPITG
ncbi:MAG: hypothetical protein ACW99F_09115 [Candidatus Hodarchaeales archaeon]|jgi:hypothetical protein